ncbi:phage/plasmid primase, P4 family [Microtetraspora niveoalba]|uniref:phage/plasmid primase, P4 family n=1 Tax=Microtetraspora niveoalba TaxID=46175 RepID=UPI00083370E9|nr:phage/plasmid primase, P4 family [Microtetraspora niveoalba]
MTILAAALNLHAAGLSVIPAAIDGSKSPLGSWKRYMRERMNEDDLRGWFTAGHPGIGVVTGAISGQVEMIELEGRAIAEGILGQLVELLGAAGLGDAWTRMTGGYLEQSPSGGLHVFYRLTDGPARGNVKLAERPARDGELTDEERAVLAEHPDKVFRRGLIETRGEGGFVVVAPSDGTTHPSGKPWLLLAGGPYSIAPITCAERDAIHQIARLFDQTRPQPADVQEPLPFTQPGQAENRPEGGVSPGDDYEQRVDWADLLGSHGWTLIHTLGRTRYWRRPGKNQGISATTGRADDRDRLYVFTTSTEFEPEVPHTKLGAYAVLEHGGDHSAAAKALHAAGYGRPAPEPARPARFTQPTENPQVAQLTEPGNLAPAAQVTEPDTYSLTDDGNALRLVDQHHGALRYCPQRASWLTWDGHLWRWDQAGTAQELARGIARGLPEDDLDQRRHRKTSLSARGLNAMLVVARTDPRIVVPLDHLDAQPYELNTPSGVVNLRTGQMRQPDPSALHARTATTGPDFTTPPERWLRFLAQTFGDDVAMTTYVQRLLGVSLVGTVLEQLLPFCFGEGANGKTTLLGVMQRLLGIGADGYALSVGSDLLLATQHNGHPTELAQLSGARLVVTSELEDGQRFAEARVKMLTGRDPISARFMRADFFTFRPTHTLWLLANHQPQVRAGGPALWRRLKLLPFLHVVPPEDRDPHLEDTLVDKEGPSILAWAIQGAADYFAHGIAEPESVKTATDAYAKDQDSIARFVEEMCEIGSPAAPHMVVRVAELRAAYEAWCRGEGEQAATAKGFGMALQRRFGIVTERSASARFYRGIRLTDASSDSADASSEGGDASQGERWGGPGW